MESTLLDVFDKNITEHEQLLETLMASWYTFEKVFLRDLLSGPYSEIEIEKINQIQESLQAASELIPVLVGRSPTWEIFAIELHSSENPL